MNPVTLEYRILPSCETELEVTKYNCQHNIFFHMKLVENIILCMRLIKIVPVCTWSPGCNADILTDFPLAKFTVDVAGKQAGGGGGGGGGGGEQAQQ